MTTMIDPIERRCRDCGDETIVIGADAPLSGAEFWARVSRLCEDLQEFGVAAGARVALGLPVSDDLYVAIAATWLARAAFVPVDPAEPPDRRERILADSHAAVLLTPATAGRDVTPDGVPVLGLANGRVREVREAVRGRTAPVCIGGDEAYVIFTSGTTARPRRCFVLSGLALVC